MPPNNDVNKPDKDNKDDLRIVSHLLNKSKKQNDFQIESGNEIRINATENENITNKLIDNANTYFLLKILSPELSKNELKKREHKDQLIKIVKTFLIFQFIILSFLLLGTLAMVFIFHGFGNDLKLPYIDMIIKFIGVYITSVVIELIAMLRYIVSNVFDTSITGLVELFKDATGNNKEELKEQENKS